MEILGIVYCVVAFALICAGIFLILWAAIKSGEDKTNDDDEGMVVAGIACVVFVGICWPFVPLFYLFNVLTGGTGNEDY